MVVIFSVMESFCAIDVEFVETEDLEESLARVTVLDGNFKILLGEFLIFTAVLFFNLL